MGEALHRAGVGWTTHALRRAATTRLYDSGVDAAVEAALLGHTPAMAMRLYREVGEARMLQAVQQEEGRVLPFEKRS